MKTLEYIDSEIARLDEEEREHLMYRQLDSVLEIGRMKIMLMGVREVAHADKMAQDKLDFERRIQSC